MSLIGSLISAGSNLLGGIIGAKASRDNTQDQINFARDQAAASEALQREFAQHGIRWRVEDAKAAGLHPLFALGGSGATFTPAAASINFDNGGVEMGRALAAAGQDLGRAISAQKTPVERQMEAAALRGAEARAEKDFAEAAYWRSRAAREFQGTMSSSSLPLFFGSPNAMSLFDGQYDVLQPKPAEIESRSSNNRSAGAGTHVFWRSYEINPGKTVYLPFSDEGPAEVLQSIPLWFWPVVLEYNRQHLGESAVEALKSVVPFLNN